MAAEKREVCLHFDGLDIFEKNLNRSEFFFCAQSKNNLSRPPFFFFFFSFFFSLLTQKLEKIEINVAPLEINLSSTVSWSVVGVGAVIVVVIVGVCVGYNAVRGSNMAE